LFFSLELKVYLSTKSRRFRSAVLQSHGASRLGWQICQIPLQRRTCSDDLRLWINPWFVEKTALV